MRIQCTKCGRILDNPNWNPKDTCKYDNGYFRPVNNPTFPVQNYNPLPNPQELPEIPHFYISKSGFSTNPNTINQPPRNNPPRMPQTKKPQAIDKEERIYNLYEKIRIYGFYVLLSLVIGYALYRVIKFIFLGG